MPCPPGRPRRSRRAESRAPPRSPRARLRSVPRQDSARARAAAAQGSAPGRSWRRRRGGGTAAAEPGLSGTARLGRRSGGMRRARGAALPALAALVIVAVVRAQVQQEPFLETTEGTGINITCSHPEIQSSQTIFWYRQLPGRGPEYLVSIHKGSKELPDSAGRVWVSADRRGSALWLGRPRRGDAAVYYCALGPRAEEPGLRPGTNRRGRGRAGPAGGAAAPPAGAASPRSGRVAAPGPTPAPAVEPGPGPTAAHRHRGAVQNLKFIHFLSLAVASSRAQVQQEPFLETTEGTGINITCSHSTKLSGDWIHFYRQLPGGAPEFLALAARGSKEVPAIAGQLWVSQDGRWSALWLGRPRRGDAAVYYCALGPRAEEPGLRPGTNRRGRGRAGPAGGAAAPA
ncbi:uncharacterized protein LOC120513551 [Passer montanus]|uniref:uncharacterized protein LOC120513551 n=1 Tax=Passer montanus TaxID=9160 RepID=UPI00195F34B1|nr:uncharacterized protein LOC120513551 [Passer montanus]